MKRLILILSLGAIFLWTSCGGGDPTGNGGNNNDPVPCDYPTTWAISGVNYNLSCARALYFEIYGPIDTRDQLWIYFNNGREIMFPNAAIMVKKGSQLETGVPTSTGWFSVYWESEQNKRLEADSDHPLEVTFTEINRGEDENWTNGWVKGRITGIVEGNLDGLPEQLQYSIDCTFEAHFIH